MNEVNIKAFLLIGFILAIPLFLIPLDPAKAITHYSMQKWGMTAGLPGNAIYAIQQTADGYLWLGTQSGLVRFDGVEFDVFSDQVKNNKIQVLFEDQNHILWIGTTSAGLFSYQNGQFTPHPKTEGKPLTEIKAIAEDTAGNILIGCSSDDSEGLTLWQDGRFSTYTTGEKLPSNQIYHIYKDAQQQLWITTAKGIVKMTRPGEFHIYASNPKGVESNFTSLYDSQNDNLWIGSSFKGLTRIKQSGFTFYGKKDGVPDSIITCLRLDGDTNLWIGTDGNGLTRLTNQHFTTLTKAEGLADDSIYALYEDRENNLWIGTLNGGLQQLRDSLFTTYTRREGLLNETVQCLWHRSSGELLIGTSDGLFLWDRTAGSAIKPMFQNPPNSLIHPSVVCLFETPDGVLWIGTYGGLHRYQKGKLTTFTTQNDLSDNHIESLLTDSAGITWVGTRNGLNRIKNTTDLLKIEVLTDKKGLSNYYITFLFQDKKGDILVGTETGLMRIPGGDTSTLQTLAPSFPYRINYIYQDQNDWLWLGTPRGLIRWQAHQEVFTPYTIESGLIEDYVCSILEDRSGNLWLGGENGVSRISQKELMDKAAGKIELLHPESFNENDGMKSRFCNGPAIQTPDGRFWFSTAMGVAEIDPNRIQTTVPKVLMKKIVVDGKPMSLDKPTEKFGSLPLKAGTKRIEFYYTGVSFINSQKILFKIKLDGYDRDWIYMENIRNTTYNNLSPGTYTFHVTAMNPNGTWNPDEASLSFTLKPSFLQTPWPYILTVFFLICTIIAAQFLRVRALKRNEKKLSHLVALRTRDLQERNMELEKAEAKIRLAKERIEGKNQQLESQTTQLQEQAEKLKEMDQVKSRFFANISHEFRTPLTLIMGPLEQMLGEEPEPPQKKRIQLMLRNSHRLLDLINQLLELSKFESGKVRLHAARQNIVPLLKGIVANFLPLADHQELELIFVPDRPEMFLNIDAEKLDHILGNLLINAIKFTPAGGQISLTAEPVLEDDPIFPDGLVRLTLSDTGPGIPREQLPRLFNRFYQSESAYEHREKGAGIGLALVKELVQLHHGTIDVHSHEGRGTQFIIHLPIGDTYFKPGELVPLPRVPRPDSFMALMPDLDSEIPNQEAAKPEPDPSSKSDTPPTTIILVVDDSADVRAYVRGSLEPLYTVLEASDGEDGLRIACQHIPDLVVSDIMMPRVDGLELCRRLKEDIKTSHIPVILLTAKAAEENIIRGLETGADDYITKPFNTKILLARIKNLVDLRHQRHEHLDREMTLQPVEIPMNAIDKEFMKQLKTVIHHNLANTQLNVEQLAKELSLDRSTLYRKILALTGETPLEFIHSYRLKRAADLLRKGTASVLEVAMDVGFSSASYFAKCFKKKFLRSPSEIKEKIN